jgi:hypothetical protein
MVLKAVVMLMLATAAAPGWAADQAIYNKALGLAKKRQYQAAADLMDKAYGPRERNVPLPMPYFAARMRLRLRQWQRAEEIVANYLPTRLAWWPPQDASAPEVGQKLKREPKGLLQLMFTAAEAKSERFREQYENLTPARREALKAELKLYVDALSQTDFEPAKVQELATSVQEKEEHAVKEEFKTGVNVFLSYWTWEDRMVFSVSGSPFSGHAEVFTPCLGASVDYTNAIYQFIGGACAGMGKTSVRYDDGKFDNAGKATIFEAFGGAMKILNENGTSVGAEAHAINRILTAESSFGVDGRAEDMGFVVLGVGRFHFWKVDLKLKGGAMIANPSAVWSMELSIPVY